MLGEIRYINRRNVVIILISAAQGLQNAAAKRIAAHVHFNSKQEVNIFVAYEIVSRLLKIRCLIRLLKLQKYF